MDDPEFGGLVYMSLKFSGGAGKGAWDPKTISLAMLRHCSTLRLLSRAALTGRAGSSVSTAVTAASRSSNLGGLPSPGTVRGLVRGGSVTNALLRDLHPECDECAGHVSGKPECAGVA